ncbi:MAG: Eco57I restriction-modification methylase domain-containing protein [Phycisphaeraceae bacterium]|nr:Eco57I restriction-modification methylase domain-containing protein [Phycisphaeraceae bacterium]
MARFMASLPTELPRTIRLLDPGAGAGMLAVAVCERVAHMTPPRHMDIHAYETDESLLDTLRDALSASRDHLAVCGHTMDFTIHPNDFILRGPHLHDSDDLFGLVSESDFDVVVMNPPYLKIGKDSDYARAMARIVHGQPNLYAFFMSLGASALKPGGQFVAITPRSFANGPYFRTFRQWFLSHMSIQRLHLFHSRRDAFSEAGVLQENIITHAVRCDNTDRNQDITISYSEGRDVPPQPRTLMLPASFIVDNTGGDAIIRIPASEMDAAAVRAVESWPDRFRSIGLRVSTGPVVAFRAREFIQQGKPTNGEIPLLCVQNVHPFRTVWPAKSERKTFSFRVSSESERLLIPSCNYVLIRRFSAKEETHRLTASPVYADAFGSPQVAIENHLNYVYHAERPLTRAETMGIAAVLNSRLLDTYFRAISGNTQVNAAEIRAMPFPSLAALTRIGELLSERSTDDRRVVDRVVLDTLRINGPIREFFLSEDADVQGQ